MTPQEGATDQLLELSERWGIPFRKSLLEDLALEDHASLPIPYLKRMGLVPLFQKDGVLTVAVHDPNRYMAVDELARRMGFASAQMVLSPLPEIHSAISLLYERSSDETERGVVEDLGTNSSEQQVFSELEELSDLMDATHEAPVIRLVNVSLTKALRLAASDVHIEPYEKEAKVRLRVDGVLYDVFSLPRRFHSPMVSRIKVMAQLDIAERRIPQDGRMRVKVAGRTVDIRVSVIPMTFGERVVLRLLDKGASPVGLEEMGMTPDCLQRFSRLINKNSGILLVTGPTGSGKTTTLYASISRINSREKNIVTIEDPVEYELAGVGQIQVNPKTELTFARALRSVLRHDPDVIMVGEIRDRETAEIAVQASLTGHLVFSTLHTNDAAGALTRLVDMGVEPFLIASSLMGVVAQRLVRRICPECREGMEPPTATLKEMALPEDQLFFHGRGCSLCMGSGYRGRTGIFELLPMEPPIRNLLTAGSDAVTIRGEAVRRGMSTLFQEGLAKVKSGITTLDEVLRVTQE